MDHIKAFFAGAIDDAKRFLRRKSPNPDTIVNENDNDQQIKEKFYKSINIQFKELKSRISDTVKERWNKSNPLIRTFICICAIPASPVILIGLFIESFIELIRGIYSFFAENKEAQSPINRH